MIILFSGSFYPRQAKAFTDGSGWAIFGEQIAEWGPTIGGILEKAYEKAINIATTVFRKVILDMIFKLLQITDLSLWDIPIPLMTPFHIIQMSI